VNSGKFKYIFIAGLEHSGTTLLSQLLASLPGVLSLGEVGQFLSSAHMQAYLARWGKYQDVTRCSCGSEWSHCSFWSDLMKLNGRFGANEISEGYARILEHLVHSTNEHVIVDSSKSLHLLAALRTAWARCGLSPEDLIVVVLAKDPRGFADSMGRKEGGTRSVISYARSMNWWTSAYSELLKQTQIAELSPMLLTYEQLCICTEAVVHRISGRMGCSVETKLGGVEHWQSHIALGNKNFVERNRSSIRYDESWKNNWRLSAAQLLSPSSRSLYRVIQLQAVRELKDSAAIVKHNI